MRRLAATADILIENFKPDTMEKWGLGPDALHAINPRLIIVRVSGYDQTGPWTRGLRRDRRGDGRLALYRGRRRSRTQPLGRIDWRQPGRDLFCMGDLAALHARERTGKGQVIDSALYEAMLQVMEGLMPEYIVSKHVRQRTSFVLEGVAPSNVYPCIDDKYLIGANQDAIFSRLCQAMGQPELASDPRYATHVARGDRQHELDADSGLDADAYGRATRSADDRPQHPHRKNLLRS